MAILRTDSKCKHEDILDGICMFAMEGTMEDELRPYDHKLYPVFTCGLENKEYLCHCYIFPDGVIDLGYDQQEITDELDRELEEKLGSLQNK